MVFKGLDDSYYKKCYIGWIHRKFTELRKKKQTTFNIEEHLKVLK